MNEWPPRRTPAEIAADRACCLRNPDEVKASILAVQRIAWKLSDLCAIVGDTIALNRERTAARQRDGYAKIGRVVERALSDTLGENDSFRRKARLPYKDEL